MYQKGLNQALDLDKIMVFSLQSPSPFPLLTK